MYDLDLPNAADVNKVTLLETAMPTKLPNASYVKRILMAIEEHPVGSLVVVVLASFATIAACLHK